MPVHTPGPRLMHAINLKFVQKKVSGGGGRSVNAELSLVSMIDFLVVTVVFLLMTFSASAETLKPALKCQSHHAACSASVPASQCEIRWPASHEQGKGGKRTADHR